MLDIKKWYAIYTRPRWEKKVAELLTRKKIDNYCPVNRVYRQWSDRKKIVLEPLFTSYVFVHITETEQLPVRLTDGVINFVYWLSKPAVIRNEEIDTIRRFLNEHDNIQLEKIPVKINDDVQVIGGPLMDQKGKVIALKNKTVKISLPSLGYMMIAEVAISNVELIVTDKIAASSNEFYQYAVNK
jgi:transcription antitermination factor NusG